MTDRGSWETFEHTADVGVRLRAPTLPDLFATAARALYSLSFDPSRIRSEREDRIEIEAGDLEDLLFDWLREILARYAADRVVYAEFDFDRLDPTRLAARAIGEEFHPDRHGFETEIKAVTAHGLMVREVAGGYEAQVIFDV